METRMFLFNSMFSLCLVTVVNSVYLKIGGVFDARWAPFLRSELQFSQCYDGCHKVCVNLEFLLSNKETLPQRLSKIIVKEYDILFVEHVQPGAKRHVSVLTPPFDPGVVFNFTSTDHRDAPKEFVGPSTSHCHCRNEEHVVELLLQLKPDCIVLFHDDSTANHAANFLDMLSSKSLQVKVLIFSTSNLTAENQWKTTLYNIHRLLYQKGIFVILLGTEATVKQTLALVNTFDSESNRTTNFRHLSDWIIMTDLNSPDLFLPVLDNLENVVLLDLCPLAIEDIKSFLGRLQSTIETFMNVTLYPNMCGSERNLKEQLLGKLTKEFKIGYEKNASFVLTLADVRERAHFELVDLVNKTRGQSLVDLFFPNKKYKWNGVKLLVSTKPWSGFVIKTTSENETIYTGMAIELLNSMVSALNFTYSISDVPDGEWGIEVNGEWTGLVRELMDREVDLAVADLSVHSSREEVVDFIYPTYKDEVVDILYRLQDDSDFSFSRLMTPVHPTVLAVMLVILCAIALLYVGVEWSYLILVEKKSPRKDVFLFLKIAWYLMHAILSQGGEVKPRTCSGKILLASWWIFCVVFAAMYSASLTVSFCVQRTTIPFRSLEEMVLYSDYKWGMFNGSLNIQLFGLSKIPIYRQTHARMMEFAKSDPDILSKDLDTQVKKVITEKYAFISSRNSLELMAQRAPPDIVLTTLGETLYPGGAAFGVPTGSPLLPEFQQVMQSIRETGILSYWVSMYFNKSQPRPAGFQLGGEPLPLKKLLNVLCIIGLGIACALLVLLCETVLIHSWHKLIYILQACHRK